ncbi:hypothetical protein [Rhodovulum marinum]|uniref:Membrane-associated oxidoreductase n=1 Tax=Rhodovulum marinum TaxID=320662 RepID=A0A4R2PZJ8_9RHOB|nr:hypothetical protein [Rhodovulum marinum]TCP41713.1 hypothetical protein EV662_10456 [Rhodovulum marinum]
MKRKLSEFDLTPAEQEIRDRLWDGKEVVLGDGTRPGPGAGPERQVTAAFLRSLVLDGFDDLDVPEWGVRVFGARITGELDLEGARIPRDVWVMNCRFHAAPVLRGAQIDTLGLNGSALPGLEADRLEARGDVVLRGAEVQGEVRLGGATLGGDLDGNGARLTAGQEGRALSAHGLDAKGFVFLRKVVAKGEIGLIGAKLGGDLGCEGARLTAGKGGRAVSADRLEARGSVVLDGVEAQGEVRLVGAKVGGSLDCDGARLTAGENGYALSADGLEARGSVFLRGVEAQGEVRLLSAKLRGVLTCEGARLTAVKRGRALTLQGLHLDGAFFLRDGAELHGALDLTAAEIGDINDDPACWPKQGDLLLDRCRYGAFTGGPVDAAARIRWLSLQDESRWGAEFWPQPWEQCARVLREMGHGAEARAILIEKERRQRAARRDRVTRRLARARADRDRAAPVAGVRPHTDRVIGLWLKLAFLRLWDAILGGVVGYGRRPQSAATWAMGFFLTGWIVFANSAGFGEIKPNAPMILRQAEWTRCAEGQATAAAYPHQVACFLDQPEAAAYPRFNAFIYSIDTLVPVVSLEMQSYWVPDESKPRGRWARAYLWLHIGAGWALSLLAVAGFSGLIKTDNT